MSQQAKAPPVKTFRLGNVKASVWENSGDNGKTFYTVTTERVWKDGDEWKSSKSFGRDDLPKLSRVTDLAYEFCQGGVNESS